MLQQQLRFAPFRNQGLFTDHYLQDVLPEDTALWTVEGLDQVRAELAALWQREAPNVAGYNEAQLEEHFIRPVLQVLGQVWEVQPSAGSHQPDYGLFADDATRHQAKEQDRFGGKVYWSHALAVGDAKVWERKLDKQLAGGGAWDFANPTFQIYYYLAETGCRWALLTNGRHWRLYSGDPKPDMQAFYEVNLPDLLEQGDPAELAYFWLFFRREAFLPDHDGHSFLDRVRAQSALAAARLREDVQERVYRALLEACRGFVGHTPNGLAESGLEAIYDNALVFLYRLLFVLYAEAAELLPRQDNRQYHDLYSLHAIKQAVAESPAAFTEGIVTLWPKLKALFGVIDRGHPGLGVPAYNGGLFDPAKHPFLDQHEMADEQVARVVDLLARTPEGDFVDYRDLEVRHLGSIYEGLLEYKLALATEPMVVIRDQGKEKWVPAASTTRPATERCEAGELYLVTDKGERKTSGSYYTPQFIVEYIVEHTLGPLVKECKTAEQVLQLRVLDPAMGSGHFLVEATNFLARKLSEPGVYQGQDQDDESDLALLKRLVVERCIYGVDLNALAVELAKLSLWLDTVAKGQPLSFLDHHLRCGNSLIGARVADLRHPPQARLARGRQAARDQAGGVQALFDEGDFTQHMSRLVFGFGQIAQGLSSTREAVQAKGKILADIDQAERKRYREIADLWCSSYFGNVIDGTRYSLLTSVLQRGEESVSPDERTALQGSRDLAGRYRFLHWELEFPEVFFDEHGRRNPQGGFDAVIGNPPWERMKLQDNEFFALREPAIALAPTAARRRALVAELPQTNPELWAEYQQAKTQADLELAWTRNSGQFPFMGRGDTNLYAVMTERGRSLLAPHGREGFVVPSGIATDSTTSAFFADLVETKTLQVLLDFENREGLFPDVHREQKFSVILFTGGLAQEKVDCGFFLHNAGDLVDPERVFLLYPDDCALMNPNTRTCPIFRIRQDLELTRGIYQRVPVLVREAKTNDENPWGVRYLRMLDMTNDAELFATASELEAQGFYPMPGRVWRKGQATFLPLYEGKMVWHFDHRYANAVDSDELTRSVQAAEAVPAEHKQDPAFSASPRYWVSAGDCQQVFDSTPARWFVGFRDIANPNNARTLIASAIPATAVGNTLPLLLPTTDSHSYAPLLANLCTFVLDFVVRRKVGSRHVNWFVVEQLPVLPPARYEEDFHGVCLGDFIGERVLELSYTAHDLAGFAEDMGYVDQDGKPRPPFAWDEERRLHLRCQLDALYFHLYGLTREEAEYVLGTFPIVHRNDEERYGRFRTRDLIRHYYNAYAAGDMTALVQG
jgi:hypothetical protein